MKYVYDDNGTYAIKGKYGVVLDDGNAIKTRLEPLSAMEALVYDGESGKWVNNGLAAQITSKEQLLEFLGYAEVECTMTLVDGQEVTKNILVKI